MNQKALTSKGQGLRNDLPHRDFKGAKRFTLERLNDRLTATIRPALPIPRATAPIDDVREVLQGLDPVDRTAWTLHRAHGLSLVETAEACEVSVATVKRRIARAEARLQEQSNET